jgi:predicted porin
MFETAGALVAFSSAANAGITIPAGDWTLDVGGVVNAFYTNSKTTGAATASNIGTGLLPNVIAFSGSTRQNDLDIGFTIAMDPGGYSNHSLIQGGATAGNFQENRQAFLTVGDKSWGSVKFGKDLGIFASDAILNDMTLLGVGSPTAGIGGANTTTSLGGIGAGYIYADWKEQIAYTSPNWNGFQFTAGVTQAWNAQAMGNGEVSSSQGGATPAFEGKASYAFTADQVTGKVWASAIGQRINGIANAGGQSAGAGDVGVNLNTAGFGLTGYYYAGNGIGTTGQLLGALTSTGQTRDSSGGYVQGTYTIPGVGTKLGVAWGESNLSTASGDAGNFGGYKAERWTVGAYHPLTKSVNLVAEWNNLQTTNNAYASTAKTETTNNTVSLGAILFF